MKLLDRDNVGRDFRMRSIDAAENLDELADVVAGYADECCYRGDPWMAEQREVALAALKKAAELARFGKDSA